MENNRKKRLSEIDQEKLEIEFKSLIKEFVKETGIFPTQIYLIAEGSSQSSIVKYKISRQVY